MLIITVHFAFSFICVTQHSNIHRNSRTVQLPFKLVGITNPIEMCLKDLEVEEWTASCKRKTLNFSIKQENFQWIYCRWIGQCMTNKWYTDPRCLSAITCSGMVTDCWNMTHEASQKCETDGGCTLSHQTVYTIAKTLLFWLIVATSSSLRIWRPIIPSCHCRNKVTTTIGLVMSSWMK